MKYIISFLLCLLCLDVLAQKPPIDTSCYQKWRSFNDIAISNDGEYMCYKIDKGFGFQVSVEELIVRATKSNWQRSFKAVQDRVILSPDSRFMITKQADSLLMQEFGTSNTKYIRNVASFNVSMKNALVYLINNPKKELQIYTWKNNKMRSFPNVTSYLVSEPGNVVLAQSDKGLLWIDIPTGANRVIWNGKKVQSQIFDLTGQKIAFIGDSTTWYYKEGMERAVMLSNNNEIRNLNNFSNDGKRIFITLERSVRQLPPDPEAAALTIWNYRDEKLVSARQKNAARLSRLAVINLDSKQVIQLEQDHDQRIFSLKGLFNDTVVLIANYEGDAQVGESHWNKAFNHHWYLLHTTTGIRDSLPAIDAIDREIRSMGMVPQFQLSPSCRYILFYYRNREAYYAYETVTGTMQNISHIIPFGGMNKYSMNDTISARYLPRGTAGWMQHDEYVLLYDNNDIWQVDPAGRKAAINITNGYGKAHDMVFNMGLEYMEHQPLKNKQQLLLNAFNQRTKENGFYKKQIGKSGDPELLVMDSALYHLQHHGGDYKGQQPIKAAAEDAYIVHRERAGEFPNLYFTKDFKAFRQLTNYFPEKNYNWYSTELHTWKMLNGLPCQGILYKPENFDPCKKYPVIFHYYEDKSDFLHAYMPPEPSNGNLNITWYASNGYLVFTPDIYFSQKGFTGDFAVNSVVSAAQYLSSLPFVDAAHMGIQGISFGGFETNYIVTHSQFFAAASSASGGSDFIHYYNDLDGEGYSQQSQFERGQYRIGATLWENPDLYIKNSAVLAADKITTPLLLMGTTVDGGVPFSQAIAFFTALRRLNKKVWLLEYKDCEHSVWGNSALDYDQRMRQFFDHYLKGKPAPRWMLETLPPNDRGFDLGPPGAKPGAGLVVEKMQGY